LITLDVRFPIHFANVDNFANKKPCLKKRQM
jgi:hypothetical protein